MKVPARRITKGAGCAVRIGNCLWQRCYTIRIRPAKGKELINPGLLNMLEARAQPWSCSRMPCQLPPARPFCADRGTGMLTESAARDHGALVCLVGNRSLFQIFSASNDFQPTGVTVLGFTSSTRSRDWVQTSPQCVLQHPRCSNTEAQPSPHSVPVQVTMYRCTGFCGCCLKQVMSFIHVAINLFNHLFVSGPG